MPTRQYLVHAAHLLRHEVRGDVLMEPGRPHHPASVDGSLFDIYWHLGTSYNRLIFQSTLVSALLGTIYLGMLFDRREGDTATEREVPTTPQVRAREGA